MKNRSGRVGNEGLLRRTNILIGLKRSGRSLSEVCEGGDKELYICFMHENMKMYAILGKWQIVQYVGVYSMMGGGGRK